MFTLEVFEIIMVANGTELQFFPFFCRCVSLAFVDLIDFNDRTTVRTETKAKYYNKLTSLRQFHLALLNRIT